MNIVFIQPRVAYYSGGGEKYPLDSLLSLGKQFPECTLTLLTTKQSKKNQSLLFKNFSKECKDLPNIEIVELPIPKKFSFLYDIEAGTERYRWDIESLFFANIARNYLTSLEKLQRPDIIWSYYITDFPMTVPGCVSVLNILGYPRVASEYREAMLLQYDHIVSINDNIVSKWNDLLALKISKYDKLALGVNFQKRSVPETSDNDFTELLFVGRLIPRKGITELCSAVKLLIDSGEKVHLTILGEGPLIKPISDYIVKQKLDNFIKLEGQVNDVVGYMANADICILPSYPGEGQMSSVIEAMWYCGIVVTTENNGNEDYIQNGMNGFLLKDNKPSTIAQTYLEIKILSTQKKLSISRSAYKSVENNTWNNYGINFMDICKKYMVAK